MLDRTAVQPSHIQHLTHLSVGLHDRAQVLDRPFRHLTHLSVGISNPPLSVGMSNHALSVGMADHPSSVGTRAHTLGLILWILGVPQQWWGTQATRGGASSTWVGSTGRFWVPPVGLGFGRVLEGPGVW